jgi:hypothetical protein
MGNWWESWLRQGGRGWHYEGGLPHRESLTVELNVTEARQLIFNRQGASHNLVCIADLTRKSGIKWSLAGAREREA